jgi:hypothetical protein
MRKKMRLCSYVVKNDKGLAPNPFWGYCTLAVCTPNHMGIRAEKGDWFVGFGTVKRGNKLVFAMKVSERLDFDAYYHDPRFKKKKPNVTGSWRQRCGDNFYFKDDKGKWQQQETHFHQAKKDIEKDLKHPYVFISEHFYYFGENALPIPPRHRELIVKRWGCSCKHDPAVVKGFLRWLQNEHEPGIDGEPLDRDVRRCLPGVEMPGDVCKW